MVSITVIHTHYQCVSISISFLLFFLFSDFGALFTCDFGLSKIPMSETIIEQSSYLSCSKAIFVHINISDIVVDAAVWWFHSFSSEALMCGLLYKIWNIFCFYFHWVKCVGLSLIEIIDDDKKPYLINRYLFQMSESIHFHSDAIFHSTEKHISAKYSSNYIIQNGQIWWKRKTEKSLNHRHFCFSRWINRMKKAG